MAVQLPLDDNLSRVVERARALAASSGALVPDRIGAIESVFSDDARLIVATWRREGGYEQALLVVADADPDFAVQ